MSAALTSRPCLPPMWEAPKRTIRELRLDLVSEARGLGCAILASKLIAKIARKLMMRHLIVVLGRTLNVNRFSLARAAGPVFSHGSFCLVKVNDRPQEARGGTIKGLNFACQLSFNLGGPKSHDSQAPTHFSSRSSESWLRHSCFEAHR